MTYLVLLRGINIGGKNKVPMAGLTKLLESLGFESVTTYIQSGNAIMRSARRAKEVRLQIEEVLPKAFKCDDDVIKVLVLTHRQLRDIVDDKPKGFGEQPNKYHSDVLFPIGVKAADVMAAAEPHPEVDALWRTNGVVYSRRLSAQLTRSRINKLVVKPIYKSVTLRSWNTTTRLLDMMNDVSRSG